MFQRKITDNGRITIPKELLDKYDIKKDDIVEISDHDGLITLKKYRSEFVCAITGKVTSKGLKIGNSFISYEGLQIIKDYIDKHK